MKYKRIILIIILLLICVALIIAYKQVPFVFKEVAAISRKYMISIITVQKPVIKAPHFNRSFPGMMKKSFPFIAGIAIDINNDGRESVFIGGGVDQDDLLLENIGGKLVNNIMGTGLSSKSPTYGGVSIDMDNDGYSDLIVARQNGVTLYKNNKDGTFSRRKILQEQADRVPIAITVADYNKDGKLDIYISNFIRSKDLKNYQYNNPKHAKGNVLLKGISSYPKTFPSPDGMSNIPKPYPGEGDRDLLFRDVTDIQGVTGSHNTFTSIFADLNDDGYPDLVVANDAGEIEIFENRNGKFVKRVLEFGKGFWMGIGAGGYDNDGDIDLFLSNISGHVPESSGITFGDKGGTGIRKGQKLRHQHILLRNDGNFKFVDVYDKNFKDSYGFGWGSVFNDLNLDGKLDLLFGVNYMQHPVHKYVTHVQPVLMNQGKGKKFKQVYNYSDSGYGHTPLIVDLDNDGIKDVMWINVKGPLKIYSNKQNNKNNYINVRLGSGVQFVNAKIMLYMRDGKKQIRENIQGGVGFGSDQSETHTFGLGTDKTVNKIVVKTIYGHVYTYVNPKINSTLYVVDRKN